MKTAGTRTAVMALAVMHSSLSLQRQAQQRQLFELGMESDVVTFAKMVESLGGRCPVIHNNQEPKFHTHGRRELKMPQYDLRMRNPDGTKKYERTRRGYLVRVG